MKRLLGKFLMLKNKEKLWIILLLCLSGIARFTMLILPFRWLTPLFGQHYQNAELTVIVTTTQLQQALWVGRMTELVAKQTPWQSKCLVQAMMARCVLAYYGIPYVLYLGVGKIAGNQAAHKSESDVLIAHAWVSVGPSIITGYDGHEGFTIVSTFVDPAILHSSRPKRHDFHAI
ncbi:MAG: hypothetical protein CO186_05650 [Zetaproteobacteria bacterium CG_4_9_14_3_um_filter_49_83]|nr:MAG: hypothetical protein AUJ56_12275 [Zetaproteobacteria bacterium CG1_02_49_23]PIQ31272.1 MAG: hypothetical protein COW62_10195 [Zetaproteobacteria bacterium CG17_big_fil_post_rev_8_21_14_2_50_50_13]PIV30349.1 MAG: hypothetical protein COS35_07210 [Zetaproteobacteria bacterium CG02_land_8_20_14_3_00_50_9]PIY55589.1 MAG: hypothetical protein COZ00_08720 [Zetaproteobacteria bacterium CG_4_10_14_0_8_um_filter_49_80]PJA35481.1 MAG: hypothetical protein CO186_05650 [Zetaproteobacteria bacterium